MAQMLTEADVKRLIADPSGETRAETAATRAMFDGAFNSPLRRATCPMRHAAWRNRSSAPWRATPK